MAVTYILVPGAGGSAWYWHRVVPRLRERGHEAIAVELPAGDDAAELDEYARAVVEAAGDRTGLVLVAQSLGGFTAPLAWQQLPVRLLVLVNAMVPVPGEPAGQWWEATGQPQARAAQAAREGAVRGRVRSPGRVLPRRAGGRDRRGHDVRAAAVRHAVRPAVAAAALAGRAGPVPAGPGRPVLPAGVPRRVVREGRASRWTRCPEGTCWRSASRTNWPAGWTVTWPSGAVSEFATGGGAASEVLAGGVA